MAPIPALSPDKLYTRCDPDAFPFETTRDLKGSSAILGQERASEAMTFGLDMALDGYNLFVMGPPGTGRHRFVRRFLDAKAPGLPTAPDWCYVNNFDDPLKPRALQLPTGMGCRFRADMERLITDARAAIPAAFESDDYRIRRQAIEESFKEDQGALLETLQKEAETRGMNLIQTPTGIAFAPVRNGQVINPEEFQKLPEDEKKQIQEHVEVLTNQLQAAMRSAPKKVRELRDRIRDLDRDITEFAVGSLIEDVMDAYKDLAPVIEHLKSLRADILENVDLFIPMPTGPQEAPDQNAMAAVFRKPEEAAALRRYGVNVIVDNRDTQGAPIVFHDHPTYPFLMGRTEHMAQMGALVTDFSLIKGGALHDANGGYLVIDAVKLLTQPFAWDALKQALRAREIRIETPTQAQGFLGTISLEPEPIPLDVKVILIGDAMLHYLLQSRDPDFPDLFKVAAEFDDRLHRTPEAHLKFAELLSAMVDNEKLMPLHRSAVARLTDESARHAGDSERMSTRIAPLADIVREANYWAGQNGHDTVRDDDIQKAIDARKRRVSRYSERIQEEILRETILIDTTGGKVGQINGLAVSQIGETSFGKPSRITARLRIGAGKVLDVEREVELGGPLHSKGVMILTSYIASHYLADEPLSLSASIVFEQSYGGVDGDSASSTELYALLSALSGLPISQGMAVTGSVNQYGQVQAIGGVNEKIEGFFDICNARGLTGNQGVLIPVSNVKHLMLREDVIKAVNAEQFAVYSVETIDQGIELLTGVAAGEKNEDGTFPDGGVNARVQARLRDLADKRRAFGTGGQEGASA